MVCDAPAGGGPTLRHQDPSIPPHRQSAEKPLGSRALLQVAGVQLHRGPPPRERAWGEGHVLGQVRLIAGGKNTIQKVCNIAWLTRATTTTAASLFNLISNQYFNHSEFLLFNVAKITMGGQDHPLTRKSQSRTVCLCSFGFFCFVFFNPIKALETGRRTERSQALNVH